MIDNVRITRAGTFLTLKTEDGDKGYSLNSRNEILYLDGESIISDIVGNMSSKLAAAVSSKRKVFIYSLKDILSGNIGSERVMYNYPDMEAVDMPANMYEVAGSILGKIDEKIKNPKYFGVFLHADASKPGIVSTYFPVTENLSLILKGLEIFGKLTGLAEEDSSLYSLFNDIGDFGADNDERFYNEVTTSLMAEIAERVEKLRLFGVKEYVIRSLFDHQVTPSRSLVTNDFRIFLTDWNNIEIQMEPLPKALWLLFLAHPEGMLLKHLSRHRQQLMEYYLKISRRCDIKAVGSSVERLLNPLDNSVNEKCSRIKAAFISKFDERLARNYYVDYLYDLGFIDQRPIPPGADPLLKGILLDRTLVIREFE